MTRRATVLLAAAALLLPAHAADGELRAWLVPGHGKLEMVVPADWYDDPRRPQGALPRVRFFDRLGPRPPFDMTVTIAWSTGKDASFRDPARLRGFVAQTAEELGAGTVEKRLPLREIQGENGLGYFFQGTIQSPTAGSWPNLTQGAYVAGDLLLAFSILTAEARSPAIERAIAMLRTARRAP